MYNQYVQDYRAQQTFNLFSQSAPKLGAYWLPYEITAHNTTARRW